MSFASFGKEFRPTALPGRMSDLIVKLWPVSDSTLNIAALDGLRGVAVLMVMTVHFHYAIKINSHTSAAMAAWLQDTQTWWDFGTTGVHLFFVLSGFLLSLPYARALLGARDFPSTGRFYARRALRILPGYWLALLLLVLYLMPRPSLAQWQDIGLHALLIHNWTRDGRYSINTPFWTMAIEAQFYLILPLVAGIAWLLARAGRYRVLIAGAILMLGAASPAYGFVSWVTNRHAPALFEHITIISLLDYLDVFVIGMACSLVYVYAGAGDAAGYPAERLQLACRLGGVGGVSLLAAAIATAVWKPGLWDRHGALYWLAGNLVLGLGYGGVLLGVLLGWRHWSRILSSRGMRLIGVISYSLYIWHLPLYLYVIIPTAARLNSDLLMTLAALILTICITFPCAFMFYHLVERPFIQWSSRCFQNRDSRKA